MYACKYLTLATSSNDELLGVTWPGKNHLMIKQNKLEKKKEIKIELNNYLTISY